MAESIKYLPLDIDEGTFYRIARYTKQPIDERTDIFIMVDKDGAEQFNLKLSEDFEFIRLKNSEHYIDITLKSFKITDFCVSLSFEKIIDCNYVRFIPKKAEPDTNAVPVYKKNPLPKPKKAPPIPNETKIKNYFEKFTGQSLLESEALKIIFSMPSPSKKLLMNKLRYSRKELKSITIDAILEQNGFIVVQQRMYIRKEK